jgi:hypothetical protein
MFLHVPLLVGTLGVSGSDFGMWLGKLAFFMIVLCVHPLPVFIPLLPWGLFHPLLFLWMNFSALLTLPLLACKC